MPSGTRQAFEDFDASNIIHLGMPSSPECVSGLSLMSIKSDLISLFLENGLLFTGGTWPVKAKTNSGGEFWNSEVAECYLLIFGNGEVSLAFSSETSLDDLTVLKVDLGLAFVFEREPGEKRKRNGIS